MTMMIGVDHDDLDDVDDWIWRLPSENPIRGSERPKRILLQHNDATFSWYPSRLRFQLHVAVNKRILVKKCRKRDEKSIGK